MESIKVNSVIKWESAAGILCGKVKEIFLAKNALLELCPWMIVEYTTEKGSVCRTMLNATAGYIKMMKMEIVDA